MTTEEIDKLADSLPGTQKPESELGLSKDDLSLLQSMVQRCPCHGYWWDVSELDADDHCPDYEEE